MAKTLADFKKEFEAIKKLATPSVTMMKSYDNNAGVHSDYLVEHFKALGVRIHALRDAGTAGVSIGDFIGDRAVQDMVKELGVRRDAGKKNATARIQLQASAFTPIKTRTAALVKSVTDEIAARGKNVSSKLLGLNQSVKEMVTLLAEIKKYMLGLEYQFISKYKANWGPEYYTTLYSDLMTETLTSNRDEAVKEERVMLKTQKFMDKNLKKALSQARAAYTEMDKQAKLAQAAHKAKDVPALAAAKKAGAAALLGMDSAVKPYKLLVKDPEMVDILREAPTKPAIDKAMKTLFADEAGAKSLLEEIDNRRMA